MITTCFKIDEQGRVIRDLVLHQLVTNHDGECLEMHGSPPERPQPLRNAAGEHKRNAIRRAGGRTRRFHPVEGLTATLLADPHRQPHRIHHLTPLMAHFFSQSFSLLFFLPLRNRILTCAPCPLAVSRLGKDSAAKLMHQRECPL